MNEVFRSKRPEGQTSIVRTWVAELPPRMQGVLLTAIRGADTSPREAAIKTLARYYRATVIHGLNDDPKTFLKLCDYEQPSARRNVQELMEEVLKDHDAHPHHYLMHLIHAAQIVGAFHPVEECAGVWEFFYVRFCIKFHMNPESVEDLKKRLCEPNESAFAAAQ